MFFQNGFELLEAGDEFVGGLLKREFGVEPGLYVGKRRATETDEELLFMDSAQSNPPDRDLLFDREGKLLGIWSKTGALPGVRRVAGP